VGIFLLRTIRGLSSNREKDDAEREKTKNQSPSEQKIFAHSKSSEFFSGLTNGSSAAPLDKKGTESAVFFTGSRASEEAIEKGYLKREEGGRGVSRYPFAWTMNSILFSERMRQLAAVRRIRESTGLGNGVKRINKKNVGLSKKRNKKKGNVIMKRNHLRFMRGGGPGHRRLKRKKRRRGARGTVKHKKKQKGTTQKEKE